MLTNLVILHPDNNLFSKLVIINISALQLTNAVRYLLYQNLPLIEIYMDELDVTMQEIEENYDVGDFTDI